MHKSDKSMMEFSVDGTRIDMTLDVIKKILIGDREGMRRLIDIVNRQEFKSDDYEYFKTLKNPSNQIEHLDWDTGEPMGEPICYEPKLNDHFSRWLNNQSDFDFQPDPDLINDLIKDL